MLDIGDISGRVENTLGRLVSGPRFDARTSGPVVSFTFDDVPESALTVGAPILEAAGVRGTFYIAGGLVGHSGGSMISQAGVADLHRRGHEIGDHTFSHLPLRLRSRQELADDFDRNAQFFAETAVGLVPRNMAFPYNRSSVRAPGELRRLFRSARGGRAGINRHGTLRMHLKSMELAGTDLPTLKGWVDDVAVRPGWLIFVTHDVADHPTPFGTTPAILEALVAHAIERGCALLTIDEALDRIVGRSL